MMIDAIKKVYIKYKEQILYFLFGGLTTLVNIASYGLFYYKIGFSNVNSNIIAWILAVMFAYITNKIWVFESKNKNMMAFLLEIISFFSLRVLTGLLDVGFMWLTVDYFKFNFELILKVVSNIVVIVLNYIASKLVIFKHKKEIE